MPRFKNVDGVMIQFTAEEETARDTEEQSWADGNDARLATTARETRDELLANSDWTQATDSPLSDSVKAEWATYRTALRNIPDQEDFPTTVTYPTKP
jgi:hypothetical protein